MSRTDSGRGSPRAVVHKRILDVAASSPDASMEAIADEVPGATTDLVERVFEEYGDPVAEPTEAAGAQATSAGDPTAAESTTEQTGSASATDGKATDQTATDQSETTTMHENGKHATGDATAAGIGPSSLTDRQHETLRLVHDHPEWTQADVADHLGVSRATVSRRLNDIPGFEWTDRESFTDRVFADDPGTDGDADGPDADSADADGGSVAGNGGAGAVADREETASGSESEDVGRDDVGTMSDVEGAVASLDARLDGIETAIEGLGGEAAGERSIRVPPELAHKVLHACMHSDRITEDEELRLIEALLE